MRLLSWASVFIPPNLIECDKKLKKINTITPFGDPAKSHWLDECDANPGDGDIDMDKVIEFCQDTLVQYGPRALQQRRRSTRTRNETT